MAMTLEPCPFCGNSERVHIREQIGETWFHVECANCDSRTTTCREVSNAIAAWNRRAHISQSAQEVDVGAIREVIAEVQSLPAAEEHRWIADRLTRAIGTAQGVER